MAQLNPLVGDIAGNTALVIASIERALSELHADMIVFSELMLTAYPPEDLLLRPSLDLRIERALSEILARDFPLHVVLGHPGRHEGLLYNMLSVIRGREIVGSYRKQCLPNYQVFDEKRYFVEGQQPCVLDIRGLKVAFTVCEDLWHPRPMRQAAQAGAQLMININGSPYHRGKPAQRLDLLRRRSAEGDMPVLYVNQVGGQDELVFDGGSMAVDRQGELRVQAPLFESGLFPVQVETRGKAAPLLQAQALPPPLDEEDEVYRALVLGVRDYARKNGFPGVVLGLSGGIDSALTLAIAVDALGADNVHAVMMPYAYTSSISLEDAQQQARALKVHYRVIPIAPMVESFLAGLEGEFAGRPGDVSEQNLQARCRGVLLMAISNKQGLLVLTTGNKSEMAVGYATLYGDMNGGFAPIKDCSKLLVYRLARYRNELAARRGEFGGQPPIPPRVIEREPSAELRPDQRDSDSLPAYEILDAILEAFIEDDLSVDEIVARGFERSVVARVLDMVKRNEYKRRQAPPGVRVSRRAFGRDWRYPITSGYRR